MLELGDVDQMIRTNLEKFQVNIASYLPIHKISAHMDLNHISIGSDKT